MAKGQGKGSAFERHICVLLGLWWTGGRRDDIFWRSSNSGGRAKVRHYVGKGTFGQYGDIQATDPIGQPLLDLCTIEIKKGYNRHTIGDMLDKKDTAAQQVWEGWMEQAIQDSKNAGSPYWLLITCRDRREPVIFLPKEFFGELQGYTTAALRSVHTRPLLRFQLNTKDKRFNHFVVYGMRLDMFLDKVKPRHIKRLLRRRKKKRKTRQ